MPVPTQAQVIEVMRKTTKRLATKDITTSAEITVGANLGLYHELGLYQYLMAGVVQPEKRRLRIEHFTITKPKQLIQTKKLGVVPGFTIGHVHFWGEPFHNQIVGPPRANRIDASASMKKEGIRFAYHSDLLLPPIAH